MTTDTATLKVFGGQTLTVTWDGNVWTNSTGRQYAHARDAMRDELEGLIRESGDDPAEFNIEAALDRIAS